MTPETLDRQVRNSEIGNIISYGESRIVAGQFEYERPEFDIMEKARDLADAGLVRMLQRRHPDSDGDDCRFIYLVQRK